VIRVPTQIHTPDELVAVVPHLLGFTPQQSVVVIGAQPRMPTARIDLPNNSEAIAEMADSLIHGYQLHKGPVFSGPLR
jgi:hypothetical protein